MKTNILARIKEFATNYTKSFVCMLIGIIMIGWSAIWEFHSLWQLDLICVGPVWGSTLGNSQWYYNLYLQGFAHYSDVPFQCGFFFRTTIGNAYDFFLGVNVVAWILALLGMFVLMMGIYTATIKKLKTIKRVEPKW